MSDILIDLAESVLMIVIGLLSIVFRERASRSNIEFQNKWFGFKFSEKDIKSSASVPLLVGIIFIFLGIRGIFRILW